jgi:predicted ester cyclase
MTQQDENIELVRTYYEEIFNKGNLDRIAEFVSEDFTNHNPPRGFQPPPGIEGAREFWGMVRTAFPDMNVEIEVIIGEDDTVAEHSIIRATHDGPWMTVEPTGKKVVWDMSNMYRVQDGKLTDRWGAFDQMAIMRQVGVMPGRGGGNGG